MRGSMCMLFALVTTMGCGVGVYGSKPAVQGLQPGQWILVESPPKGELGETTFPPIYTWKRVRTFDDGRRSRSRCPLNATRARGGLPSDFDWTRRSPDLLMASARLSVI